MLIREIAHSRAGDKGDISNLSVIVYDIKDYRHLEKYLTAECVKTHLSDVVLGDVVRHTLPGLGAMNFVLQKALGGGVTRSLALDAHGKCLGSALLNITIPDA
ncbi:AtuA-related protein [Undibacterium sp. Di26W]|uniref:AtuA-related protein n=1 Tax=Undibacterium sp. Di26W TaxID=3413035 RepID=UPI003BF43FD6